MSRSDRGGPPLTPERVFCAAHPPIAQEPQMATPHFANRTLYHGDNLPFL